MSEEEQRERDAILSIGTLVNRWRGESGAVPFGLDMPDEKELETALVHFQFLTWPMQTYYLSQARKLPDLRDLDHDFADFCRWLGEVTWGDSGS
jgi:hypothetical protein